MTISTNPKTWYRLCQKLYKGCALRESIPSLSTANETATSASEKAAALNNVFISKASNVITKAMPLLTKQTSKCIDFVDIDRRAVHNVLQQLDSTKAPGPDIINNQILKKCADTLCTPLASLFNRSLSEGILPTEWKLAEVTALYKHKGSRNDPSNYRPISLTSSICKVMERIINTALLRHLTINKLIASNQFGFLPKHSTTDHLVYLLHELHKAANEKKKTIACFLDLAAAFDTVPHAAILHKLPAYGIRGHVLRWISNFLQERHQYVSINGQHSPISPVVSGVPQGSVVAPTLFIIFMNDLSTSLIEHTASISINSIHEETSDDHLMYADDTMIYLTGHSTAAITIAMNSMLRTIDEWAKRWSMRFNHSKTNAMAFNIITPPTNVTFSSHHVNFVSTHKHLGFIISDNLTFSSHVDSICRKAASEIFLLKRLSLTCKNPTILQRVYKSYILPIFEYASPAWNGLSMTDESRLERLQRRAIRVILGLEYTLPLTPTHYSAAAVNTLKHRRAFASLCYGYKLINNMLPPKLNKFMPLYTQHQYTTRNPALTLPGIPARGRRSMDHSPISVAVRLLNTLPLPIRALPSLWEFKNNISSRNLT